MPKTINCISIHLANYPKFRITTSGYPSLLIHSCPFLLTEFDCSLHSCHLKIGNPECVGMVCTQYWLLSSRSNTKSTVLIRPVNR